MPAFSIRNTILASFGAVVVVALLGFAAAPLLGVGHAGRGLDRDDAAFVETLSLVERGLSASVSDLVARRGESWPESLDETFEDFANAAAVAGIEATRADVDDLLGSARALRGEWADAGRGDIAAATAAADAYRAAIDAVQRIEVTLVNDTLAAPSMAAAGLADIAGIGGLALTLAVCLFGAFWCIRSITGPLDQARAVVAEAAAGNLTVRIPEVAGGEIGDLCGDINTLLATTHESVSTVMQASLTLAASATSLAAEARMLTEGAESLAGDATEAAGSAEHVCTGVTTTVAAAEEMVHTLQTIAASATELTNSIAGMNDQAETTSRTADTAAQFAEASTGPVAQLGSAADEIGTVIAVIQDIAEQANLLALNATIEAARAGDAGKGFAVVATEVKGLARQTGEATTVIRQRIEAIQASTGESVEAIQRISGVIDEFSTAARTMAASVHEQRTAAEDFARTVAGTATAAESVSSGVAQFAGGSEEISRNFAAVDRNTRDSVGSLSTMQTASKDVAGRAESLHQAVSRFQV